VIAHEIGHVALYHVQRQMVDALGLEALTSLALGQNPGAAAQVAAGVSGKAAMLANSRGDEKQADEWGITHADQAGTIPAGWSASSASCRCRRGSRLRRWGGCPTTPPPLRASPTPRR
jgi:predicted Zn-dependent protease